MLKTHQVITEAKLGRSRASGSWEERNSPCRGHELLDRLCSLRPMKGVIVRRLPRARKVPPAAVGRASICQEHRATERNAMSDTAVGREEEGQGVFQCVL